MKIEFRQAGEEWEARFSFAPAAGWLGQWQWETMAAARPDAAEIREVFAQFQEDLQQDATDNPEKTRYSYER